VRQVIIPFQTSSRAPPVGGQVHSLHGRTMGTSWSVRLVAGTRRPLTTLRSGIQRQLDDVVAQMSTWDCMSDLSRFNQARSAGWHALPREFFYVLRYAMDVARASDGAYDPTAGPLVNAWGFGPERGNGAQPAQAAIDAARARVGWQRVQLDPPQLRALQPGDACLDLSAIAKGFGVDQVARYLQHAGIEDFLVEVGGELRGQGMKPDATPWWVELQRPPAGGGNNHGLASAIVALHDLSVATSGDYLRYFLSGTRQYSHTIDPRTGEPIAHGLASVTVLHPDCIAADALSTALNVLGPTAGMEFACAQRLPALFVVRTPGGLSERLTPELQAMLE
jgi:thiamine biosynthesis lipoprotein